MSNVSSNIYTDIIAANVNAGNLGGVNGPMGKYANGSKPRKTECDYKIYRFTISNATINEATDSNGLSDGYCRIGKLKNDDDEKSVKWISGLKTKVCKKTLTPTWNFSEMAMIPKSINYILLELWDDDLIKDDFIGKCKINIGEINDYPVAKNYPVTDKHGNVSGTVSLMTHVQVNNGGNIVNCVNYKKK